jgi:hypothetical protein
LARSGAGSPWTGKASRIVVSCASVSLRNERSMSISECRLAVRSAFERAELIDEVDQLEGVEDELAVGVAWRFRRPWRSSSISHVSALPSRPVSKSGNS